MTKTKTGRRYSIHLPDDVLETLNWHVRTQLSEAQEKSDLLFPSESAAFGLHRS